MPVNCRFPDFQWAKHYFNGVLIAVSLEMK